MDKRIDIKVIQAGQPRPYADTFYEAELDFSFQNTNFKGKWNPPKEKVKEIFKLTVHPFSEAESRGWWEPYLEDMVQLGEGHWRLRVRMAYDD